MIAVAAGRLAALVDALEARGQLAAVIGEFETGNAGAVLVG
jgi:hypothetical protein